MNRFHMAVFAAFCAVFLHACSADSQPRAADNSRDTNRLPPNSLIGNEKAVETPDFQRYFDEAGVHGTFVLSNQHSNIVECYNCARADSAYIPASTFKIFNSLAALEAGAVQSEHDTLAWDGVKRWNEGWNKSQDMREAFNNSTVWFYQELARRIGHQKLQQYIDTVGYGNRNTGDKVDMFWLDNSLKISAWQQIDLLVRLRNNTLPFSQRTMDIVKDIMINEKIGNTVLRAKTGTAPSHGICWWVGYVERGSDVWYFALNINISKDDDLMETVTRRKTLVRRILADRGIFPMQ